MTLREPTSPPALTTADEAAAIQAGGMVGLVRAYVALALDPPSPAVPPDLATVKVLRQIEKSKLSRAASLLLTQIKLGKLGNDLAPIYAQLNALVLAAEIQLASLEDVANWIESHPGSRT